jgi:hypothetical protein
MTAHSLRLLALTSLRYRLACGTFRAALSATAPRSISPIRAMADVAKADAAAARAQVVA